MPSAQLSLKDSFLIGSIKIDFQTNINPDYQDYLAQEKADCVESR